MEIDFLSLVRTEPHGEARFAGICLPGASARIYGGQVVAQALWSAGYDRPSSFLPHSVHAHFLSPGDVSRPVDYRVQTLKAGRAFHVRRVDAGQGDRLICTVTVSFHCSETSSEHALRAPEVPGPGECAELPLAAVGGPSPAFAPIESRWVTPDPQGGPGQVPSLRLWQRCRGDLPDDPVVHACGILWRSDLTMTRTVDLPYLGQPGTRVAASLDHAVWFHRPLRADTWVLSDQSSPTFAQARGLAVAHYYALGGELLASAAQECLTRRPL